jgi:hypothetical protein
MDHPHPAPAQLEDVSVAECRHLGSRSEVKLIHHQRPEGAIDSLVVEAVDRHEVVEGTHAPCIGLMEMPGNLREEVIAGDVILVAVAVDDAIDSREPTLAGDQAETRVDHQGLLISPHHQGVPLRVLSLLLTEQHRDPAELEVYQLLHPFCLLVARSRCGANPLCF